VGPRQWGGLDAVRESLEKALFVVGGVLLLVWAAALVHRTLVGGLERRALLAELERRSPATGVTLEPGDAALVPRDPVTTDWALERVAGYVESLSARASSAPLALLEIPRLELSVLVLDGIDEWSLNRGVGWIPGTAQPGSDGNVGIAGHRDGFFRALRGIAPGDVLEWRGRDGLRRYQVEWTRVVAPEDVAVLAPTEGAALTLVTCHPFFYAGPAPERFVVRAREIGAAPAPGWPRVAEATPLASGGR
jgi:sortase A